MMKSDTVVLGIPEELAEAYYKGNLSLVSTKDVMNTVEFIKNILTKEQYSHLKEHHNFSLYAVTPK